MLLAWLLSAACSVPGSSSGRAVEDPLARTIEIALRAEDPALDGHGAARRVELTTDFTGTFYVWADAKELDCFLRVEDGDGKLLEQDDDSGGGKTPFLKFKAVPGEKLTVTVAAAKPGAIGACTLHLVDAPESEATRQAAADASKALDEIDRLRSEKKLDEARARVAQGLHDLLAVPGASSSALVEDAARRFGLAANGLSDPLGERTAWTYCVEMRSRILPPNHSGLQWARLNLGAALQVLGEFQKARELDELVIEVFTRTLREEDPEFLRARGNLAGMLYSQGDLAGARKLQQDMVDVLARTLPADHLTLQLAKVNLSLTLCSQGELTAARELQESALEVLARTRPADDGFVQSARLMLAETVAALGDLYTARELYEQGIALLTRTLPDEHSSLQLARGNLGAVLVRLRDLPAARELQEKVLEVFSRTLPDDHTYLQVARMNLGGTLGELGDMQGARALFERAVANLSASFPEEYPALLDARRDLASALYELHDFQGAHDIAVKVLEIRARTLPADHPDVQAARLAVAASLITLRDLPGARDLYEQALAVRARTLPEGSLELSVPRGGLIRLYACLGAEHEAAAVARELDAGLFASIASSFGKLSPRELEERVSACRELVSILLSLARGVGVFAPNADLESAAFERVEASRSIGVSSAAIRARMAKDGQLADLGAAEARKSRELARLVQDGASRDQIADARRELERLQRERLARLAADPATKALLEEPTPERLAQVLRPDEAIVSFWRYTRTTVDRVGEPELSSSEDLLAHVVRKDKKLVRIELGPVAALQQAVGAWREALQRPIERGVSVTKTTDTLRSSGEALRKLVFDPLLPALEGVRRVIVAEDDELYAVPIEALPLADGVLGERFDIERRLTLRELLWPKRPASSGEWIALGGASFNSPPESWQDPSAAAPEASSAKKTSAAGSADVADEPAARKGHAPMSQLRGGKWERGFPPLSYTDVEVRDATVLYEEAFGEKAPRVVLERALASRASLEALAPRARYLHVATHGWFAPESIPSSADPKPIDSKLGLGVAMTREEQVRGASPMLLCGLALAGANLEKDALGRVPGIITAQEIASFDLSNCELAVLSACDTNVGVRRAGQGVASLQKALHMAGARTVITSLWKVPDEATKDLMLDFYRRIWIQKKPKARALWEAKMALRAKKDAQGQPIYSTRDWAAWVLTGDPN